jgi:hypothetical protein
MTCLVFGLIPAFVLGVIGLTIFLKTDDSRMLKEGVLKVVANVIAHAYLGLFCFRGF